MKLNISKWNISIKEVIISCIWCVLVLAVLFVGRGVFLSVQQDDFNDTSTHFYEVDISEIKISQTVSFSDNVDKLSFITKNLSGTDQIVRLTLRNATDMSIVRELEVLVPAKDGMEQLIEWNIGKDVSIPSDAIVEINETHVPNAIYMCVQNKSFEQSYKENDITIDAHLRMAVVYNQQYNFVFFGICALLFVVSGLIFVFSPIQKIKIEKVFALMAILAGMVFVYINPFGQEPDGWVHFTRSMDVSEGNLFLPFVDNNGSSAIMKLPENINDIAFRKINPNGLEATPFMENIKSLQFSKNIVDVEELGGFTSLFYLPQAIGIFIARLFGMSAYGYMICGRIVNLFTYVALTYFGLKKMPIYRNIYMVIALLPMTLYQAASFSYDSALNGLCFLFIGLCFYYAYEKEKLTWKDVLGLGFILMLLFLCKYVYVCIGLLVFIIPMKKFGEKKEYWKAFGIALIPLVVMLAAYACLLVGSTSTPVDSTGAVEATQVTQLGFVLANPIFAIKVFVRTVISYFSYYVEQLNTLGWLNYTLGMLEFLIPVIMVAVAALDGNKTKEIVSTKDKIIFAVTFIIVVSAGMMGLYLMDSVANPVGAPTILGYQGRYTIPVLMLLLAVLSSRNVENKIKAFSYKVVGVMGLALTYASLMLFNKCY